MPARRRSPGDATLKMKVSLPFFFTGSYVVVLSLLYTVEHFTDLMYARGFTRRNAYALKVPFTYSPIILYIALVEILLTGRL